MITSSTVTLLQWKIGVENSSMSNERSHQLAKIVGITLSMVPKKQVGEMITSSTNTVYQSTTGV